ncbi:MAG: Integrase [Enterococcus faecalis DORA_14]|nr:MAG: Integrase [Enterococcus faecalis DORA_14]
MGNQVSYPIHIKEMAIQAKKENIPVKIIMGNFYARSLFD